MEKKKNLSSVMDEIKNAFGVVENAVGRLKSLIDSAESDEEVIKDGVSVIRTSRNLIKRAGEKYYKDKVGDYEVEIQEDDFVNDDFYEAFCNEHEGVSGKKIEVLDKVDSDIEKEGYIGHVNRVGFVFIPDTFLTDEAKDYINENLCTCGVHMM